MGGHGGSVLWVGFVVEGACHIKNRPGIAIDNTPLVDISHVDVD
ncbi:hypothetical protein AK972_2637 [Pseudomonas yamanorum]|nr:hypothetical protein AK972_2637 [Pseudomonas yamanorum]